jgi:hypothetical protein
MKILTTAAILLGLSSLIATPSLVLAHHSVGSSFDVEQTVSFEGTVSKIEWFNPHIWFYVATLAEDGSTVEYQCEGGSPNSLRRRGWSKDSVKVGDHVTVVGLKARTDPYSCYTRSVKLMDGTQLFSGNAAELER